MAVAVASYSRSGSSPSHSTPKPSGTAEGDLLVAFPVVAYGANADSVTDITAPGGFVLRASDDNGQQAGRVYTKIATASEPSTYTFGWNGGSDVTKGVAIARVTGAKLAAPFNGPVAIDGELNPGTTYYVPGVTGAGAGVVLIGMSTQSYADPFDATLPSGFTTTISRPIDSGHAVLMAHRAVSAPGSFGPYTVSTNHDASGGDGATTFALFLVGDNRVDVGGTLAVTGTLARTPRKTLTGSTTPAGVAFLQRIVVRLFEGGLGGLGVAQYPLRDNLVDVFEVNYVGTGLIGGLTTLPSKVFTGTTAVTGELVKRPLKVFEALVAVTATRVRVPRLVKTGSTAPRSTLLTRFYGRVFGRPGIAALTVRAAGEIRSRVRRG